MHEVRIETNAWVLRLVFHDLRVEQLAAGDPTTGALTDLQQPTSGNRFFKRAATACAPRAEHKVREQAKGRGRC